MNKDAIMNERQSGHRLEHDSRPGTEMTFSPNWIGASIGVIVVVLIVSAAAGWLFRSGFGRGLDTAAGLIVGAAGFVVFATMVLGLSSLIARIPLPAVAVVGGGIATLAALFVLRSEVFSGSFWPATVYFPVLLLAVVVHALLGAWLVVRPERGVWFWAVVGAVILLDVGGGMWLAREGSMPDSVNPRTTTASSGPILEATDPSVTGPLPVQVLHYGSGHNTRRPEYGDAAAIITAPIDASPLLAEWKGIRKRMRERYWGYGIDEYPINGTVWFPDTAGTFPLVLIVHGNHSMEDFSDPGYAYLGELFASRGFITVSVDENLTNATWSGDFGGDEQAIRAWILLKHLAVWRTWNATPESPFYRRVDLERIGLIGHSRGGEAVAMAAAFNKLPFMPDDASVPVDTGFGIKAVIAIAPTDYRYDRRMVVENVNYMTIHGSYDTDVSSFYGLRQYDRVRFSDDGFWFKVGIYVHRANHGQFNTVWGRTDMSPPLSWLLNLRPLLSGEAQRQVGKVYFTAFLETTLHDRHEYLPIFKRPSAAARWLGEVTLQHRYHDSDIYLLANYEEDFNVLTGSQPGVAIEAAGLAVWREAELDFRQDGRAQLNNAVYLGWNDSADDSEPAEASYALWLRNIVGVGMRASALTFSLAATDERPPDAEEPNQTDDPPAVIIQLSDADGTAVEVGLDEVATVRGPVHSPLLMKTEGLSREFYGRTWEPILASYEIPFTAFRGDAANFDAGHLRDIRFRFPRARARVIVLDDIGLRLANP
jgi:hypothetical protein